MKKKRKKAEKKGVDRKIVIELINYGQFGQFGHFGQFGQFGQLGQFGQFGQIGQLGQIGQFGQSPQCQISLHFICYSSYLNTRVSI
ncbi:predicted protein [Sclerotinia sclerotiorum 1980 UF-70]|uniref:Uncharacterized protein n=1 Tax=Sclerotinia sclerotiorum (strain ATCC 18683 / 1980 / Ss-1) TaxID=665079 RepID=A7EVG1_SCLS1|nr:predicted protein [Sclerotinia sclerotiorum 1980 UF-70]EDN93453.1 predicted protein [Sclerotinia sclerotiorum 1980 UF-70]